MKTIAKKRLACLIGIAALAIFAFAANASADYIETFSTDNAGWTAPRVNDDGSMTYPAATWNSSGGNPDGDISSTLSTNQPRLYVFQPNDLSPYGNMTGKTLTADFKIDGTVTGPTPHLVRFYVGGWTGGSNYYVTNDTYSWDPNSDTSWTTHQVQLLAANFITWPNQNAGTESFADVIAAPNDIGLVFADEFASNASLGFSGSGTISVDNFGTVPEPGTLTLFGLAGLCGLAMAWIRRRQSSG